MNLHIVFFLVSLTLIGFFPMLAEIGYATLIYSCYLTLREWEVVAYIALLAAGIIYGFVHIFAFSNVSLLFYIINLVFYCLALYWAYPAYRDFRKSGGIYGKGKHLLQQEKKLKEELLQSA